jgi:dGTPase
VPFLAGIIAEVETRHPGLDPSRVSHELVRRVITRFVEDAIAESARRIAELAPADIAAIRGAGRSVVAFSSGMQKAVRDVKSFLFTHMYRAPEIMSARDQAQHVVTRLFAKFLAEPQGLPADWRRLAEAGPSEAKRARIVADYIAGMTDRYAATIYGRFFDDSVDLG